jgi:hypothetical protein
VPNTTSEVLPLSSLAELKTRSAYSRYPIDWESFWFQTFVAQSPNLFLGHHSDGVFNKIDQIKTLDGSQREIATVERMCKEDIRRLNKFLKDLREICLKNEVKMPLSLVCKNGSLGVFQRNVKDRDWLKVFD